MISKQRESKNFANNSVIEIAGFTNYLLCDECCLFDATHRCVCHEMNHPFAHYFIAASYNTYLVEDQLKGPSSSDGYLSALKRNCRFIESKFFLPSTFYKIHFELFPSKRAQDLMKIMQVLDLVTGI